MSFLSLFIGLFTLALVLNSLFLILVILAQLPKKEAGAGLAFGGAASDALFGAGSGTVLSRMTKYATGSFLVVSLTLSIMQTHNAKAMGRGVSSELEKKASAVALPPAAVAGAASNSALPAMTPAAPVPPLKAQTSNAPATLPASLPPTVTNAPATTPEAPGK